MKNQHTSITYSGTANKRKHRENIMGNIRYDVGHGPIRFYLKQASPVSRQSQIILTVNVRGKRLRVYTRMKIEPAFWDRSEQRCINSEILCARVRKRAERVNNNIAWIILEVERKDRILAEHGEFLTMEHIRSIIMAVVNPARSKAGESPIEILRNLAKNYTSHLNARGQKGAASSSQTYLMAVARLERFAEDNRVSINDFSCFNKYFYDRFREYLVNYQFEKSGKKIKYTSNTILNTISVINNLTRKAYEMNLGGESYYKGSFSFLREAAVKIYLTEKELDNLKHVRVHSKSEAQIRDMFLIASYTALRISDINRLSVASFSEDAITIQQQKTKGSVYVPILKEVRDLVCKYRSEGFPVLNVSAANFCIKELARRAGIDDMVLIPETRGGVRTSRRIPKYTQVSFHTARRSCITNLFRRGYSANYLMSLSGHKSLASFQRYIKSDAGEMSQDFIKELKKRRDI